MRTIAIAEGHNTPQDMGAEIYDINTHEYFTEFFENRKVTTYAMEYLYNEGYEIEDFAGHLIRDKIPFINNSRAKICVEIHHNANNSEEIRGAEVIYHPSSKKGKKLAQCISDSIKEAGFKTRGIFEGWYRYDKSLNKIFALLSRTKVAAVIVEVGYLTNLYDRRMLRIEGNYKKLGIAVAKGIINYVKT